MIGKELLSQLQNFKYNEREIVFIAKDKSGNIVWLERGNASAGLTHILIRHGRDFEKALGIRKEEIALHLYNAITNGELVDSYPSDVEHGINHVYNYDGNYYTFVATGSNGFIVTSFPFLR